MRILLIEDDEQLGEQVQASLQAQGYHVRWQRRGDSALAEDPEVYDLITLDLMLPGAFGLDVLRSMRERSGVPILVLSGKRDTAVRLRAFELGADDYVQKPFWPEELIARVQARLRRPILQRQGRVDCGGFELDLDRRCASLGDEELALTRAEFDILAALAKRPGAAVTRAWLAEHVLCPDRDGGDRAIDVHVSRLRRKLGPLAERLKTVWGVGYRLNLEV